MPSPSTAAAAAAAAGAPVRHRPCAPRRLSVPSCSLLSPAFVNSTRLTAPAPPLVHRPRPSLAAARAASPDAATGPRSPASGGQMLVFVPPHPLIKHWVSVLRNEQTPCAIFRSAMAELGRLLIYEASRDLLPTITGEIQTPVAVSTVEFIDPREPVIVVPILRAGLALAENASSVLPATKTYHLGLRRDEETLQPSIYLNNLPDKIPEGTHALVVDPMLATAHRLDLQKTTKMVTKTVAHRLDLHNSRVASRRPASMGFKSELDRYLDEEMLDMHTPNFKVLDWWKVAGTRFPTLRRIARDIFAIPVTTVASESAFSTGGRVLSEHRSRLTSKMLEALMCSQNWLRNKYQVDEKNKQAAATFWSCLQDIQEGLQEVAL